jgi:RHS repeat-associated protein
LKRFQFLIAIVALLAFVPNSSYAHRYFDSWAARWTMPDPALIEGNPQIQIKKYGYKLFEESPYGYCSGNPLKFVDPNGKQGNLNLGGPILLPTSWKQFEYNVVATITATAVTAGILYAPSATATVIRNVLGNPAATGIVTTVAAEALAPPGASVTSETGASAELKSVTSDAAEFFQGTKYSDKVLSQMGKGDLHSFSELVTNYAQEGKVETIIGKDGVKRVQLEIPGSYQGKEGVFQFIKEPDGMINHRFFKPNGK